MVYGGLCRVSVLFCSLFSLYRRVEKLGEEAKSI